MDSLIFIGDKETDIQILIKEVFQKIELNSGLIDVLVLPEKDCWDLENRGIFEKLRSVENGLGPYPGEEEFYYEKSSQINILNILESIDDVANNQNLNRTIKSIISLTKKSIEENLVLVFLTL